MSYVAKPLGRNQTSDWGGLRVEVGLDNTAQGNIVER